MFHRTTTANFSLQLPQSLALAQSPGSQVRGQPRHTEPHCLEPPGTYLGQAGPENLGPDFSYSFSLAEILRGPY